MKATNEAVEFKEFDIGDTVFHNNIFWAKVADREAKIISSTLEEQIGAVRKFTGNCLVNIVI